MLMVIVGAGASYDSLPSFPPAAHPILDGRPPLANDLFADRPVLRESLSRFPACHPIVPYLRSLRSGASLESILGELRAEAVDHPARLSQLVAVRYYLHDMLSACEQQWEAAGRGITNYITLLDQIDRWRTEDERVCLITFNYDRLLENALRANGFLNITDLSHYVLPDRSFHLIKLHGSVDWGLEVDTPLTYGPNSPVWTIVSELTARAGAIQVSSRFRRVTERPIAVQSGTILFPAIALPLESKQEFMCPPEHLEALTTAIPEIDRILMIGWRGTENHFLRLLKEKGLRTKPRLFFVAGSHDAARETMQHLDSAGIQGENTFFAGGFTEFVTTRAGDAFLRP